MYTMEELVLAKEELVLAKKTKKDVHRTPQDLNWPTVPQDCTLHTLRFGNRNLVTLDHFSHAIPQPIDANAIKTLILSGNKLSNINMNVLNVLQNLEHLNVSDNEISTFHNSLHKLKILNLSRNKITSWNWDKYVTIEHTNLSENPLIEVLLTMPEYKNQDKFLFKVGEEPALNISETEIAKNAAQIQLLRNAFRKRIHSPTEDQLRGLKSNSALLGGFIGFGACGIASPLAAKALSCSTGSLVAWLLAGGAGATLILGGAAYGLTRLAAGAYYKQQIEQEKLDAEQKSLRNIITDKDSGKEGHVALDMSDCSDISEASSDS